ncbi:hypothetical protein LZ30DRAFT_107733 [Colletotrichum cereale]|nr:hypothetical protein LZ30DRAFT_107733 [Colletotrichum cereale]
MACVNPPTDLSIINLLSHESTGPGALPATFQNRWHHPMPSRAWKYVRAAANAPLGSTAGKYQRCPRPTATPRDVSLVADACYATPLSSPPLNLTAGPPLPVNRQYGDLPRHGIPITMILAQAVGIPTSAMDVRNDRTPT